MCMMYKYDSNYPNQVNSSVRREDNKKAIKLFQTCKCYFDKIRGIFTGGNRKKVKKLTANATKWR